MPDIPQQLQRRISDAARAVSIAKTQLERARTFEERLALQAAFDRAEREMNATAMEVNRGISRVPPPSQ